MSEDLYLITVKGEFAVALINKYGMELDQVDEIWHTLEAICMKRVDGGLYPGLVWDGEGGTAIGCKKGDCDDENY